MSQNRVVEAQRLTVVHQLVSSAHTPQRRRAQLVASRRAAVLNYAVARSHIMQQEIAERVDQPITERRSDCEYSPIYYGSRSRSRNIPYVADSTANPVKCLRTGLSIGGSRQSFIARRRLRRSHEAGEFFDIFCILRIGYAVEVGDQTAVGCVLDGQQRAGYSHLVQVGVRGERNQTGVLILPSESAYSQRAPSLEHWHPNVLARDSAAGSPGLAVRDRYERFVIDGFYKAVAQSIQRRAQCSYLVAVKHTLLKARVCGPGMDE